MTRRRQSQKAVELIEEALRELQVARRTKADSCAFSELTGRPSAQTSGSESMETNAALETAK
jgi:hypothetical protein